MADPLWYEFRSAVSNQDYALAERMLKTDSNLSDLRNGIGETVLHYLAVENDTAGVAWLHSHGFDLNVKNKFGTPVVFEVAQLGYKDLLLWFAQHGADLSARDGENLSITEFLTDINQLDIAQFVTDQVMNRK